MRTLIDVVCLQCGALHNDVWTSRSEPLPSCCECGGDTERTWAFVKAPGITPQGTRAEINTDGPKRPKPVDVKAIAMEKTREVEQKWLRFSDDKIAEQHMSREINERAGIADAQGNEKPIPKQAPITFSKPSPAECAV